MAKNDSAFTNQTGNFYDWIEIHNPGISNVDLEGWFLTDEKAGLQKWEFPATNINAGAYMLVFASDLNKRTPGEELHTNFKLSSTGELLALIKPDGITISHAYYPAFPEQFADISYGLNPASHSEVTLLESFAPCKAVVPENDGMSSNWIQRIYDDNSWVSGNTGVGYDTEPNYFPLIGLDLSNSMFKVNASCYIRIPFYVGTVSPYDSLLLKMKYNQMYFAVPSPCEANNEDDWAFVKDTKFSVDRGFYSSAFDVAITTATENATIRYTLNGSRPTETHGTVYSTPITISGTTVLRAFGYKSGFESSDVDAQTYIFIDNVVNQPSDPSGWPATFQYWKWDREYLEEGHWETVTANWGVNKYQATEAELREALTNSLTVSLSTDMDVLFDRDTGLFGQPKPLIAMDHPLSVEIFDAAGGETIQLNAAARLMGTASAYPEDTKPNLRLLFKSEFIDPTSGETFRGPGKLEFPVFEDTEATTFNTLPLRGMLQGGLVGGNGTAIKDAYVHRRFQAMGYNTAVHCRYVNVYLNGLYMGVFQIQERPDDAYMEEYFGGVRDDYDIKKTIISGVDIGLPDAWNALQELVPFPTGTLSPADYQILKDDYIDLERYADYMLLEMFIADPDWPGKNFYWNCRRGDPAYGPPDLKWIPFTWDADFAIQTKFVTNDLFVPFTVDHRAKSPLGRIWNNLYNNTAWRRLFGDRVHRYLFNGGELSVERANSSWLELRDELSLLVAGEICKWSTVTPEKWDAGVVAYTTTFWTPRHANCLSQLRSHGFYPSIDAPVYSQHGGVVPKNYSLTMTNLNGSGTIWYTTDDTDPRDSGTAIEYTGSPVTIQTTTRVKACVDSGSEWSAMNEAIFQVAPTLIVSEIMYNPIGTGPYDTQEYEFIELHNNGTSAVDLSPVQLTKGVDFSFSGNAVTSLPANAYVVVVRNPVAFSSRYKTIGMLIAGTYSNALNNGGEKITLSEKYEQVVTSFIYDNAWYPETDGAGYSLVHLDSNPATDPNSADYWEASKVYLGSPGKDDPILPANEIVINEFMYNSPGISDEEYIELYNFSDVDIPLYNSISNSQTWLIKDDTDVAYSFEFGDIIKAGGLVVVVGEGVDPTAFRTKFSISPDVPVLGPCLRSFGNSGDAVKLFKPDETEITNVPYILVEQVEYNDMPPWPPEADGGGNSLQRISALGFANDPYNWEPGGTPGRLVPEPVGIIWIMIMITLLLRCCHIY